MPLRKCVYILHNNIGGVETQTMKSQGWFHGFSTRAFQPEYHGPATAEAVAIIEDCKSGQVHLAYPENIQFLDKPDEALESKPPANLKNITKT